MAMQFLSRPLRILVRHPAEAKLRPRTIESPYLFLIQSCRWTRAFFSCLRPPHPHQLSVPAPLISQLRAAAIHPLQTRSTAATCKIPPTTTITTETARRAYRTSTVSQEKATDPDPDMASSSSDQDYMAFLNKANEDPAKGTASTTAAAKNKEGKKKFRTRQEGVEVPAPLTRVCERDGGAFYVSDADEPFEAVALGWDEGGKGLPDEEEFARLIEHWDPENAEIEIQDPVDWDRNGQYKEVVAAVREAGEGNDVRVYRVGREGVKAEYWVITTEGKGKEAKLVGVKALAVES